MYYFLRKSIKYLPKIENTGMETRLYCKFGPFAISVSLKACNGFSPKIVRKSPDLRIFTEIWILRLHLSDLDGIFTIGSVFAFRARCRTPFPADFAKNAVSENFYCQFFSKIFVLTFAKIR